MTSVYYFESGAATVSTFLIRKDYNDNYYALHKTGSSDGNSKDGFTLRCKIPDENRQRTLKMLTKAFWVND